MVITNGKMVLYGINDINNKLESIIKSFHLKEQHFEIKLILSEAITNAFIHGNKKDASKPIRVKWEINSDFLCISVRDSGKKLGNVEINKNIGEDVLRENGRGLYIISSYADEVRFEEDSIIMKVYCKRTS